MLRFMRPQMRFWVHSKSASRNVAVHVYADQDLGAPEIDRAIRFLGAQADVLRDAPEPIDDYSI